MFNLKKIVVAAVIRKSTNFVRLVAANHRGVATMITALARFEGKLADIADEHADAIGSVLDGPVNEAALAIITSQEELAKETARLMHTDESE